MPPVLIDCRSWPGLAAYAGNEAWSSRR